MSEMRVRSEGSDTLELVAHNPVGGLFALAFAVGIYVLSRDAPGMPAALARGMAIFFAVVSLFAMIWRDRLHFDVIRRRWERTRGPWPFLRRRSGFFDVLEGVVEDEGYRRGRPESEWEVWIRSAEPAVAVRLAEAKLEDDARRQATHYQQLLGLD